MAKQRLVEIREQYAKAVFKWMSKAQPSDYAFGSFFDNKWRVVIDYEPIKLKLADIKSRQDLPASVPKQVLYINRLADGFEVHWKENLVVRRYLKLNPKDGKEYPSTEKYTIGTFLNRKFAEIQRLDISDQAVFWTRFLMKIGMTYDGFFENWSPEGILNGSYVKDVLEAPKWWNEHSFEYIDKDVTLGNADEKFQIVISRHPIDILRMGDHDGIDSCHSQGGEYFYCALQEAQGHGPVAYLVKPLSQSALENLQTNEFFYDPERHVGTDVVPLARIRLREVRNIDEGYSIALPEGTVYTSYIQQDAERAFKSNVYSWLHRIQDPQLPEELSKAVSIDIGAFRLLGGEYADTGSAQYFQQYFTDKLIAGARLRKQSAPRIQTGTFDEDEIDNFVLEVNDNMENYTLVASWSSDSDDAESSVEFRLRSDFFITLDDIKERLDLTDLSWNQDAVTSLAWAMDRWNDHIRELADATDFGVRSAQFSKDRGGRLIVETYVKLGYVYDSDEDAGDKLHAIHKRALKLDQDFLRIFDGLINFVVKNQAVSFANNDLIDDINNLRHFKLANINEKEENKNRDKLDAIIELLPTVVPMHMIPRAMFEFEFKDVMALDRPKLSEFIKNKDILTDLMKQRIKTCPHTMQNARNRKIIENEISVYADDEVASAFDVALYVGRNKLYAILRVSVNANNFKRIKDVDDNFEKLSETVYAHFYNLFANSTCVANEVRNVLYNYMPR